MESIASQGIADDDLRKIGDLKIFNRSAVSRLGSLSTAWCVSSALPTRNSIADDTNHSSTSANLPPVSLLSVSRRFRSLSLLLIVLTGCEQQFAAVYGALSGGFISLVSPASTLSFHLSFDLHSTNRSFVQSSRFPTISVRSVYVKESPSLSSQEEQSEETQSVENSQNSDLEPILSSLQSCSPRRWHSWVESLRRWGGS